MLLLSVLAIATQVQVAFSSSAVSVAKPNIPSRSKPTVYLIRHGEKPETGDSLNTDGLQRAECLRNVFGKNSSFAIDHILAQQPQPDGRQRRSFDTVLPLSKDLGLEIDTHCERDDYHCVKNTIKHFTGSGNILICWEHTALTNITGVLGDESPPEFPGSAYHHIWTDPWPYIHVDDIPLSQNCPGLDTSLPLSQGVILLLVGLGVILAIAIGLTVWAIIKVTGQNSDGYEPIE